MKNILFSLVLMVCLGEMRGQKNRFFRPDYRDCVQFGTQYYRPNSAMDYGDVVYQLLYSHDLLKKNNLFLRSRTGIDLFHDWGFHMHSGLMIGGRADFLEYSIGPILHAGSYFEEYNNIPFRAIRNNNYFKLGLNITGSATIAKILVLGWEWQAFRATSDNFSSSGSPIRSKKIWVKSFGPRLGFWF